MLYLYRINVIIITSIICIKFIIQIIHIYSLTLIIMNKLFSLISLNINYDIPGIPIVKY